jgi:class 3 adenylate cyclase
MLKPKQTNKVSQLADMSIMSFIKIISACKRSYKLDKYKYNKSLNERMPNYSVKMGFGLHVGWAIEGAIGSDFKIDASYLSPNVNVAASLEAGTKAYGSPILVSEQLYELFTSTTKTYMRQVDRVTIKGKPDPFGKVFLINSQISTVLIWIFQISN